MNTRHLRSLLAQFAQSRVLVIGDMYLDELILGRLAGVSLEAPVPVFEMGERRYNPGAAGNVACNLAALGAQVSVVGVVGADANSDILREEFRKRGIDATGLVVDAARPTNTYGKFKGRSGGAPHQEILRVDTPTPPLIEDEVESELLIQIGERANAADALVVVDQIDSVVTESVLEEVRACAAKQRAFTAGDSRGRIRLFQDFDLVAPNEAELMAGLDLEGTDENSLETAASELLRVCRNALITRGAMGVRGINSDSAFDSPALGERIVDVTGAGDSLLAAATLTLMAGGSLREAALAGNAAAAAAVARPGAVAITPHELEVCLPSSDVENAAVSLEALQGIVDSLRADGKTVVWTNGCFDILHAGHVTYLKSAKREGDVLVVGLNSDASVRELKGADRPIVPEGERALIISALECVDYVTIFSDADAVPVLEVLKPDVFAKGGDYTIDTTNQDERQFVETYGGRMVFIAGVEGQSTTNLVQRITGDAPK